MPPPRLPPLPLDPLPPACGAWLDALPRNALVGRLAPVNVLGTLLYAPTVLPDFLRYWSAAKTQLTLSFREQELVILRLAVLHRCDYIWRHHVPVAAEYGVTAVERAALRAGPAPGDFPPRETALLALTEVFQRAGAVDDAGWARTAADLAAADVVGLIHLVAQYQVFALVNNVLRVPLEPALRPLEGLDAAA